MAENQTKMIKVKIIRPVGANWREFEGVLRELEFESFRIKNKTIQICWEFLHKALAYKDKFGKYPKEKDILGKSLRGFAYSKLRQEYDSWHSEIISQLTNDAITRFNIDKREILTGDKSIPSFRKGGAFGFKGRAIELTEESGRISAKIPFLSREGRAFYKRQNGSFEFLVGTKDRSTRTILRKIINGEYKLGASQIRREGRDWYIFFSYNFSQNKSKSPKEGIMGIDLGITNAVYVAFNDNQSRYSIKGGEIERFRKYHEERRRTILTAGRYAGEGRRGRGYRKRTEPSRKLKQSASDFTDTTNHKYSSYIVELAEKYNVEKIQMEDLSGISKRSKFLRNWPYFDLQEKITYKANEKGIKVVKINPKYTSQLCSVCHHLSDKNRSKKDSEVFKCENCGEEMNADYNAAKNISNENIENIIKEKISEQKKKTA